MKNERRDFAIFLLVIATLAGGLVRLLPAITRDFAMNDGGLFYSMVRDLIANQFALPEFTSYNHGSIPFAYPPLGFYLTAGLATLGIPVEVLFQWLPGILTTLSIPVFFLLARDLLKDELQAGLASLFFAFVPVGFMWLIMGGGVTRAPGLLFGLLTLFSTYRMYVTGQSRWIGITAICASLLVLSHPESAFQTVFSVAFFFIAFGRSRRALWQSLLTAALSLGLTSPWWLAVLNRHGWAPFRAALGAHPGGGLISLFSVFQFNLTGEPLMTVIAALGAFGALIAIRSKNLKLVGWLLVTMLADARTAPLLAGFPLVLLAAQGLEAIFTKILLPETPFWPKNWFALGMVSAMTAYILMSAALVTLQQANLSTLTSQDLESFSWVNAQIPDGSRFLILTGKEALSDPVSEWFPALSGKISLATVQGSEWSPEMGLIDSIRQYNHLQACIEKSPACLDDLDLDYTHAYIRRISTDEVGNRSFHTTPLEIMMRQSDDYSLIYESKDALIFEKK